MEWVINTTYATTKHLFLTNDILKEIPLRYYRKNPSRYLAQIVIATEKPKTANIITVDTKFDLSHLLVSRGMTELYETLTPGSLYLVDVSTYSILMENGNDVNFPFGYVPRFSNHFKEDDKVLIKTKDGNLRQMWLSDGKITAAFAVDQSHTAVKPQEGIDPQLFGKTLYAHLIAFHYDLKTPNSGVVGEFKDHITPREVRLDFKRFKRMRRLSKEVTPRVSNGKIKLSKIIEYGTLGINADEVEWDAQLNSKISPKDFPNIIKFMVEDGNFITVIKEGHNLSKREKATFKSFLDEIGVALENIILEYNDARGRHSGKYV